MGLVRTSPRSRPSEGNNRLAASDCLLVQRRFFQHAAVRSAILVGSRLDPVDPRAEPTRWEPVRMRTRKYRSTSAIMKLEFAAMYRACQGRSLGGSPNGLALARRIKHASRRHRRADQSTARYGKKYAAPTKVPPRNRSNLAIARVPRVNF